MRSHVLIVANRTAASPDLTAALVARDPSAAYELIVPPTVASAEGREAALANLEAALRLMADAGLDATGSVGTDSHVVVAAVEAYDPARHDEIVVSTLPEATSHWLHVDGPARIARATGALVHHVTVREPRAPARAEAAAAPSSPGVLAPLMALGYGPRARG